MFNFCHRFKTNKFLFFAAVVIICLFWKAITPYHHPSYYSDGGIAPVRLLATSSEKSSTQQRRAKGVIVILAQNKDADDLHETLAKFELTFNRRFNYPYVFLNDEPFDDDFRNKMAHLLLYDWQDGGANETFNNNRNVSFGLIPKEHWSHPEWIDKEKAEQRRLKMVDDGVVYADRPSYFHMCRFNSGFFYRHHLLDGYDYYWRIEPRTEFGCILDYDPFVFMMDRGIEYGYVMMMPELLNTIPTLWNTTKKFIKDIYPSLNIGRTQPPLLKFLLKKENGNNTELPAPMSSRLLESIQGLAFDIEACHFWSNFEIGSLNFFRSHLYQSYFDYLDKAGGFFYERWGDAPVHSLAVGMFLDLTQIHHFADIGYKHDGDSWCPVGKDFPKKCFCDPGSRGNMATGRSDYSFCIARFLQETKDFNHKT